MKARGLVVVLALVLATLATAGVFLYTQGVRQEAKTGGTLVAVVVSKVDIPANSDLNPLIADNKFKMVEVPKDAVVDGAVTSVDALQNKRNNSPILAGEQIPAARIQGEGQVPGGALGIPDGYQAMTVALDAPRAVGAALAGGDQVAVYATLKGVSASLVKVKGAAAQTGVSTQPGAAGASEDVTVLLVPSVQVLRVIRPGATTSPIGGQQTAADTVTGTVSVTLALLPEDAQRFVFAMEEGTVWLSLLAPGEKGTPLKPISYAQVLK